jgi:hypothetical protein
MTPQWPAPSRCTATRPATSPCSEPGRPWKSADLAGAQQAEVEKYEAALARLCDLYDQVLAVAAELAHGTVG